MATALLEDIDKETVDFRPNYDESESEPEVLPSRVPNLLVNGSSGIAVGMATNLPPHNLTEIVNATIHLIEHPGASLADILPMVEGPDFPPAASSWDARESSTPSPAAAASSKSAPAPPSSASARTKSKSSSPKSPIRSISRMIEQASAS